MVRLRRGFTLIELLITIGIIAILAGIIVVAVAPRKSVTAAKDSKRLSDIKQTQNALYQYLIEEGAYPNASAIPTDATIPIPICKQGVSNDPACVNLDALVPKYIPSIPQDDEEINANFSGYAVILESGRLVVSSMNIAGVPHGRQNLILNGYGFLRNNTNFTAFTYEAGGAQVGSGSFVSPNSAYTILMSDQYIPVDITKKYRLIGWAKSGDSGGANYNPANTQYFGFAPYDIDNNLILPPFYSKFSGSKDTTLALPLSPGDLTMTLADATGWNNTVSPSYLRQFTWWPYADSTGYNYPPYTYTRNTTIYSLTQDIYNNGMWAPGAIVGNVITLRVPWPGPVLPAGTPVRNSNDAGTYKYLFYGSLPNTWTQYGGLILGTDVNGTMATNLFPYGTASVRPVFLVNFHGTSDNVVRLSGLWFSQE